MAPQAHEVAERELNRHIQELDEDADTTITLRLASASARQSPALWRALSPLLHPLQTLESSLHSFVLVDLLKVLGVPKTLSSLALVSAASFQSYRAYTRHPKFVLAALTLLSPLKNSLACIQALNRGLPGQGREQTHAGLLAWWFLFGSVHMAEVIKVRPLALEHASMEQPSTPSWSLLGTSSARPLQALQWLSRWLQSAPKASQSSPQIASNKPKISLLKRTFGPRWPLFKLLFLLALQHSDGQLALALVRWLVQPIQSLLSALFSSSGSKPPRKVLKVVYEEEEEEVVEERKSRIQPDSQQTPRTTRIASATLKHHHKQPKSRPSSPTRDHDWTRASTMLDSGILSTQVWDSPRKKSAPT